MQTIREIVLLETKPETEWIDGEAVQKVLPTTKHSMLQTASLFALYDWANADPRSYIGSDRRGNVGAEWRFRVTIPGIPVHPLVPDVAYMSFARLRPLSKHDRECPSVPPEIVVEVLSPDDRPLNVENKRVEYLAWGVSLVLIANPEALFMDVHDSEGRFERVEASTETYSPEILPSLQLPLRAMFAKLEIPDA